MLNCPNEQQAARMGYDGFRSGCKEIYYKNPLKINICTNRLSLNREPMKKTTLNRRPCEPASRGLLLSVATQ